MANPGGGWSRGQFIGWGLGAFVGVAPPSVVQVIFIYYPPRLSPGEAAMIISVLTMISAFAGGALGYAFAYRFDSPLDKFLDGEQFRSSFLFGLVGSMLIFSIISFPLLALFEKQSQGALIVLYCGMGFISGFIPAALKGVLNNLYFEYHSEPPPRTSRRSRGE